MSITIFFYKVLLLINLLFLSNSFLQSRKMDETKVYSANENTKRNKADSLGTDDSLKYVQTNEGNSVTFDVDVKEKGHYKLKINYKGKNLIYKNIYVSVNGATVTAFRLKESLTDLGSEETNCQLFKGTNQVTMNTIDGTQKKLYSRPDQPGDVKIYSIEISPYEGTPFSITKSLITENATEDAKKMYSFLLGYFEKKIISGVMLGKIVEDEPLENQEDVRAIYERSGKYPALVGFDFDNATGLNEGTDLQRKTLKMNKKLAIDLFKRVVSQFFMLIGEILED